MIWSRFGLPRAARGTGVKVLARLAVAALLALAPWRTGHAAEASYTLRLASWGTPTAPQVSVFVPAFIRQVEAASKGRIAVQSFPAGALVKEQEVPSAIESHVVDISLSEIGGWASISPAAALMNSVLFRPTDADFQAFAGAGSPVFAALAKSLRTHGVVLLAVLDNGPPMVVSRARMTTPADFKGKVIRTYDKATSELIHTLGGAPSTMPVSDVYPALQRGTVQAAIGGIQGISGLKEYEVTKYLLNGNGAFGVGVTLYVMNAAALDALPPDLQKVVIKAGEDAERVANTAIIASFTQDVQLLRKHGMQVTELQPGTPAYQAFINALAPLAKAEEGHYPAALIRTMLDVRQ